VFVACFVFEKDVISLFECKYLFIFLFDGLLVVLVDLFNFVIFRDKKDDIFIIFLNF
jgi:hypothetical protein